MAVAEPEEPKRSEGTTRRRAVRADAIRNHMFWQHVQPYGEVRLDVAKRLSLGGAAQAPVAGNPD